MVFVPAHITGFFQIFDHHDPLKKGSRGAGMVLDKGVITEVKIKDGSEKTTVKIDGKDDKKTASITFKTVELFKSQFELKNKKIAVKHWFQVPIGSGFGTSASCALGTSLALARILDLPLTYNQSAAIAHTAEILMHSGLGDVIAELHGGMILRLKEGAPGHGMVDKIILNHSKNNSDLYVLAKSLGELDTSRVINDPVYMRRINHMGKNLLFELLKNPKPDLFLRLSKKFALKTGLMDENVKDLVLELESETMGASMAMLGKTAFAISKSPESSLEDVITARINSCGCKFL